MIMKRFIRHNRIFQMLLFFYCYVCFQVKFSLSLSSFSSFSNRSIHYLCPPKQSLALLQFKSEIPADSKPSCNYNRSLNTDSWKEGSDCCSWDGVTCNEVTGNVIGLDLDCSCLRGIIDDNSSLFQLSHLQWLNLAYNNFKGSKISPEFGRLTELTQLNLSYANFRHLVPSEISLLSKLTLLDLSNSGLDLSIEPENFDLLVLNLTKLSVLKLPYADLSSIKPYSLKNLSSSMMIFDLGHTGIQGQFPEEVFQLPILREIHLQSNHNLTGYLPKSNLSSHLRVLDLTSCNFKGEIPESIGNLHFLEILLISGCSFTGLIPTSMNNLTQLTELAMESNNLACELPSLSKLEKVALINFARNMLTGEIPNWLFTLPSLENIDLSSNKLTGSIEQLNFSISLQGVFLSDNEINGKVPSSLLALPSLSLIDLSSNKLTGPIEEFNFSNSLLDIQLQDNEINGKIPPWLFTLPYLSSVDLSSNKLIGTVEQFNFSLANSVLELHLQDNEIHGAIPSFVFELVNLMTLDISSNNLSGTVKFDMFSKFQNLGRLDLSNNILLEFSSTSNMNYSLPNLWYLNFSFCNLNEFPMFLRTSERLQLLDLSNNRIDGRILKTESEGWKSLTVLDLSNNFLPYIEHHPWQNIKILHLQSNRIQGSILIPPLSTQVFLASNNKMSGQIPPSICRLSSLQYLSLFENNLSGIIPPCLGNVANSLRVLHLQKNNLQGSIPDTFTNGSSLMSINLNSNQLEGPLPRSLANCRWLEVVSVGSNMISDTFPCWLGTLQEFNILILRSNRFYGPICDSKTDSPFKNLQIIDLSHNEFTGRLPKIFFARMEKMVDVDNDEDVYHYFQEDYNYDSVNVTIKGGEYILERISNIFTSIDLSRNQFQGEIPKVLGKFKSLVVLNLSHNSLTGNIPVSLANLTALESLDLSFNKLDGRIPDQLVSVTTLSALNLSYNQLSGPVPEGNQFNTFENDSFIGNKGLCGKPLSVKCNNDPPPSSISNEEDGNASRFNWKFVMMGYASGVVIGISMGYISFSTGKPQWFARMVEDRLIEKVRRPNRRRGGTNR